MADNTNDEFCRMSHECGPSWEAVSKCMMHHGKTQPELCKRLKNDYKNCMRACEQRENDKFSKTFTSGNKSSHPIN